MILPIKPKRLCRYVGCKELVTTTYCNEHIQIQINKRKQYESNRPHYHAWYSTERWKAARLRYLRANPLCVECLKDNIIEPSYIVDHIKPHKGDYKLFWNMLNWQSLCKQHHDIKTASGDGGFGNNK